MDVSTRSLFTLLVLAVLCGPAGGEDENPSGKRPSQSEIDAAIEKGVEWLKREQDRSGSFDRDPGPTGLALYALAHSGVPDDDPSVERALRWLVTHLRKPSTYNVSLTIMALATLDREGHAKRIRRLAERLLVMGQCESGQWSYRLRTGRSHGDNSNTQLAVLGLWYARQAGARIEKSVWKRCHGFFVESQNEDGGWGYSAKERKKSYGSMVATGLAALLVCRSGMDGLRLEDDRVRKDPATKKAVAWLAENLALDENPGARFKLGGGRNPRKEITESYWRHYWLWSLERAATIAGAEKLGGRDWYAEGAAWLLETQKEDGSWANPEKPLFATCFALLFLSRSTRRAVATEAPGVGGVTTPKSR